MMTRARLFAGVVMLIGAQVPLRAAVDCDSRLSAPERFVCSDESLAALDHRLDVLYSLALEIAKHEDAVAAGQADWVQDVRDKCGDASCLGTAYRDRVDVLWQTLQQNANPLPHEVTGRVQHAPSLSPYCSIDSGGSDAGDWFSVALSTRDQAVSGTIDGIFDCGRKVWGPVELHGRVEGHLATVEFQPAWNEQGPPADALILVATDRIYWRVLNEVEVESYVPVAEDIPAQDASR